MSEPSTPSELFVRGLEQIAQAFGRTKMDVGELQSATKQTLDGIRQGLAEHEDSQRRVSAALAAGARLSRRRDL